MGLWYSGHNILSAFRATTCAREECVLVVLDGRVRNMDAVTVEQNCTAGDYSDCYEIRQTVLPRSCHTDSEDAQGTEGRILVWWTN